MKAMLYADWMNLRRSMKAIMIAIIVIALVSIWKRAVICAGYAVYAVAYGTRNAHEQRLCLRMG